MHFVSNQVTCQKQGMFTLCLLHDLSSHSDFGGSSILLCVETDRQTDRTTPPRAGEAEAS